jgi:hypothetical protein
MEAFDAHSERCRRSSCPFPRSCFPLVLGGVIFAVFLFFPLFLLALAGVLDTVEDRTVARRDPSMDPSGWRERQ